MAETKDGIETADRDEEERIEKFTLSRSDVPHFEGQVVFKGDF